MPMQKNLYHLNVSLCIGSKGRASLIFIKLGTDIIHPADNSANTVIFGECKGLSFFHLVFSRGFKAGTMLLLLSVL